MKRGLTLKFKNKLDVKSYLKSLNKCNMYKVQPILVIKEESNIGTDIFRTSFESIIITDNEYHIKHFDMVIEEYLERYDTNNYSIIGYELYINILSNNILTQEYEKKMLIKEYESKKSTLDNVKSYIKNKVRNLSNKIHKWVMRNI